MRSRRLFAAVVLAMLAALVLTLPASAAPLATLEANMTGEQRCRDRAIPTAAGRP